MMWCLDDANEGGSFFGWLIKCVVSLIIPGNSRKALVSRFLFGGGGGGNISLIVVLSLLVLLLLQAFGG